MRVMAPGDGGPRGTFGASWRPWRAISSSAFAHASDQGVTVWIL